ncbi:ribonuclease H-like protein [Apiospora phragmitis]|uniref:ribonuclease H n=1 Tax=Apiospora phragmitis TaxID=2905665 RepID=A0ABR1VUL4_9PEZI
MPRGWYLAQGMFPLGEDSSDDDEGHDYSFMDEVLNEDEDDEEDDDDDEARSSASDRLGGIRMQHPTADRVIVAEPSRSTFDGTEEKRRGTGRAFPTKFRPPSPTITPEELFAGRRAWMRALRSTHSSQRPGHATTLHRWRCLNNGQANPKAGWAFVHNAGTGINLDGVASARLEAKGPFGDDAIQSSNRAELRAVIAALRFRHWVGENFHTVVIATDSEYVVEGSTVLAKNWIQNGWRTSGRAPVKNSDLWELLLGEVERWKELGMTIQFWRIPREWNGVADAAAKKATEGPDVAQ